MDAKQGLACHLFLLSISRERGRRQTAVPQHRNPREADRILLRLPPEGGREGGGTRRSAKKGRPAQTGRPEMLPHPPALSE